MHILAQRNLREGLQAGTHPCRQQSWWARKLPDPHAWQSSGHGTWQGPGRLPGTHVPVCPHRAQGRRSISIPAGLIPARSSYLPSLLITKAITKKQVRPSGQWLGSWRLSPGSLGTADKKGVGGGGRWGTAFLDKETEARGCSTEERLQRVWMFQAEPCSCQLALPLAELWWHRTRPSPPHHLPAAAASGQSRGAWPRRCRSFSGATLTPSGSAGGRGGLRGREAAFSLGCEVVRLPTPTRRGPRGHQSRGRRRGETGMWKKAARTSTSEKEEEINAGSQGTVTVQGLSRKRWSHYRISFLAEHAGSLLELSSAFFPVSFRLFPSPHWIKPVPYCLCKPQDGCSCTSSVTFMSVHEYI